MSETTTDAGVPLGKYLVRFSLYYVALIACVSAIALIWPEIANYATIPALMGAASGVAMQFVHDTKRPLSDTERKTMTRVSFVLAWVLSVATTFALLVAQAGYDNTVSLLAMIWTTLETPPNGLITAGVIALLSLAMYYALHLCYGRIARKLASQVSKL